MSPSASVSVVIPCYNEEAFVAAAVASACGQSHDPTEVIVVDDGSTDGTMDSLEALELDFSVVETPNTGASAARNAGLGTASGDLVLFLDADDVIGPEALEHLVEPHLDHTRKMITASRWWYLEPLDKAWRTVEPRAFFDPASEDPLHSWLAGYFFPSCALLWRREDVLELGGWDPGLSADQDGDLMLRALTRGFQLRLCNGARTYYRRVPDADSISSRRTPAAFWSRFQVVRRTERYLLDQGRADAYMSVLARRYLGIAVDSWSIAPETRDQCLERAIQLADKRSVSVPGWRGMLVRWLGIRLGAKVWSLVESARAAFLPNSGSRL